MNFELESFNRGDLTHESKIYQPSSLRIDIHQDPLSIRAPISPGWSTLIGNMFKGENGQVHVCDFNCNFATYNPSMGLFVCAISGLPSRGFTREGCKRASPSHQPSAEDSVAPMSKRRFVSNNDMSE